MTLLIVLIVALAVIATALVRHRMHLRRQQAKVDARRKQQKVASNAAARR